MPKVKVKTPNKKGSKITAAAIGGKSFRFKPQTAPGKTPCPRGCGGHIIRRDDRGTREYYNCSNCKWVSTPHIGLPRKKVKS